MGYRFLATLVLAAGLVSAGSDEKTKWTQEVRKIWRQVEAIPLGDPVSGRELRGPWLKKNENGAYKVERYDGSVAYVDVAPRSAEGVRAVWKRTRSKDQWVEVSSRGDRIYSYYWTRLAWIGEQKSWQAGSARRNRSKRDDALWKDWMRAVTSGDHMKGTGVGSWRSKHRTLIRDLAQLYTAREKLDRIKRGKTKITPAARPHTLQRSRERIRYYEDTTTRMRNELAKGLRGAGNNLGAGDALWLSEEAALRLYEAENERRQAEATHAMYKSMARRKPEYKNREQESLKELERASREIDSIRRQRRHAMANVMKALG